jgi:hypothetical protein
LYPDLFRSRREGKLARMYAHVQIVSKITINRLWKLKIADCEPRTTISRRRILSGGSSGWQMCPHENQLQVTLPRRGQLDASSMVK